MLPPALPALAALPSLVLVAASRTGHADGEAAAVSGCDWFGACT